MTATLGHWGEIDGANFNVGKGTKIFFSVQVGTHQGVSRGLPPIN